MISTTEEVYSVLPLPLLIRGEDLAYHVASRTETDHLNPDPEGTFVAVMEDALGPSMSLELREALRDLYQEAVATAQEAAEGDFLMRRPLRHEAFYVEEALGAIFRSLWSDGVLVHRYLAGVPLSGLFGEERPSFLTGDLCGACGKNPLVYAPGGRMRCAHPACEGPEAA